MSKFKSGFEASYGASAVADVELDMNKNNVAAKVRGSLFGFGQEVLKTSDGSTTKRTGLFLGVGVAYGLGAEAELFVGFQKKTTR